MLAAALLVVVQVASVAEIANPRPTGWVTDQAGVLPAADRGRLDALADGLARDLGVELAVVTVDDVPGTPKQFATELFNHWGIGSAQTNTGVLVLLVIGQRRLEIETGDGIEAALPAAWLADLQRTAMVPRFKQQDFAGGLVAGVTEIAEHLRAAPPESTSTAAPHEYRSDGVAVAPTAGSDAVAASDRTDRAPDQAPDRAPDRANDAPPAEGAGGGAPVGGIVVGALAALGAGGGGLLFARNRRRQRTCQTCAPPQRMVALSEVEDDAKLEPGQVTEERIGSVDYEVLVCPGCQASRTLRHGRWFSGYGTCSGCGYKTMKSSSTTLVSATYDHGGQVEVTETCANCPHTSRRIRHTARLVRSSSGTSWGRSSFGSSGSRGGGGFSGGRSSGGGAGSSW